MSKYTLANGYLLLTPENINEVQAGDVVVWERASSYSLLTLSRDIGYTVVSNEQDGTNTSLCVCIEDGDSMGAVHDYPPVFGQRLQDVLPILCYKILKTPVPNDDHFAVNKETTSLVLKVGPDGGSYIRVFDHTWAEDIKVELSESDLHHLGYFLSKRKVDVPNPRVKDTSHDWRMEAVQ